MGGGRRRAEQAEQRNFNPCVATCGEKDKLRIYYCAEYSSTLSGIRYVRSIVPVVVYSPQCLRCYRRVIRTRYDVSRTTNSYTAYASGSLTQPPGLTRRRSEAAWKIPITLENDPSPSSHRWSRPKVGMAYAGHFR